AKSRYNPNSEDPGFTMPKRVQVGYLMPKEKVFQNSAAAVAALLAAPVVTPTLDVTVDPLLMTVAGLSRPAAFAASLQRDYENLSKPGRPGWEQYYFDPWPSPIWAFRVYHDRSDRKADDKATVEAPAVI